MPPKCAELESKPKEMKLFLIAGMLVLAASGCKPKGMVTAPSAVEPSSMVAFSWDKATLTATNESGMSGIFDLLQRNRDGGKTIYGQANAPLATVFPDGIKFVYDGKDITGIINTNGEKISLEYDSTGRVMRIVYPNGSSQGLIYDIGGAKPISIETGKVQ